jgi:hypothetical protein
MLAIVPPISLGAVGTCLDPSYVCAHRGHNQVFYGRYLKKLSNKTQEALGDMTKVIMFLTELTVKALFIYLFILNQIYTV